jgi:pyruvate formate lyase activating enzyme
MQQAILWKPYKEDIVQCRLCSHFCLIKPGERGKCGVRYNDNGQLMTLVKDRVAAMNLDPIEKKPLYHCYPGTKSFSIGTMGCNFSCTFCQNYSLSQGPKPNKPVQGEVLSAKEIVLLAQKYGAASISYTYSEPTIFIELVMETARLAQKEGIKNILVSNGFQSPECLEELEPYIDAVNIDLKAFTEKFYQNYCGAKLKPVLKNLERIKKMGWWLEVTTLIIPGLNDSDDELKKIASFIYHNLSQDTPWHISKFYPAYKMTDRPSTPISTLERAYSIGKETGLDYVYTGNVPGHSGENTYCPACSKKIITRMGFQITDQHLKEGKCEFCGHEIAGRWE